MPTNIDTTLIANTGDQLGWIIWLIIAIVLLAIVGFVVSYFVRKKKNQNAQKKPAEKPAGTHVKSSDSKEPKSK